uniref:Uncharacterized protein n=1 Tax=Timema genevievae TaxID=629358 RepID=A0A7R9K8R9_TIMGE|nr:unnamed protein product [Timema genevievae]
MEREDYKGKVERGKGEETRCMARLAETSDTDLECIVMGLSSKRKGRWRYRFWQKMFLTLIGLPLLVGLVLGFVAIFRAVFVTQLDGSMLHIIDDQETQDIVDESQSMERAERLAGALKIATISYDTDHQENENLLAFIRYLEKGFPLIHSRSFIKREVINKYSLLFTVQGLTRGKLPYLLASHLDVVPVDAKAWEFPPFSGRIVNRTYVYGRGAIDDKAGVMVNT